LSDIIAFLLAAPFI